MAIYPQYLLDLHDELIVDLFAGGGGASTGIEMATGRQVDVAINHDPAAVAMHKANHPQTTHHVADVWEADPHAVTADRPVGLLWASPDCRDHSKAKGGKPIRNKRSRSLAWVVKRWAAQVRPRVMFVENVEEFVDWGPLVGPPGKLRRDKRRKGRTFRQFVREFRKLGYEVEWRELRACDYGAPTIRQRLYMVARCDGQPIEWPEPTHGPGTGQPYRTAAECIDWSIPMLSIFATPDEAKAWAREQRRRGWRMGTPRRPLADATLRRIARGVMRFVVEAPEPFIVGALVPTLIQSGYGERDGQAPRSLDLHEPLGTVVGGGSKHALVAAYLVKLRGTSHDADPADPLHTISAGGNHHGLVAAFLQSYYGTGIGQDAADPLRTVTAKDRLALVTVQVHGEPYYIADIAMRMLWPRELYTAQGFPPDYEIERGVDGRRSTKTEMVRMVGNSVAPPVAAALVQANVPEMIAQRRSA